MSTPKPHSNGWLAAKALAKASMGLLNPNIWILSIVPLLLAAGLWTGIGHFAWEPLNDWLRGSISTVYMPTWLPDWLPSRSVWIPLAVLLVSIPGVMLSAIVLVSMFGTNVVAHRVAKQYGLEPLAQSGLGKSASWLGSVWHSAWVLVVLGLLWLITLPAWLIPGLGLIVPLLLLAWANARLFSRDVLMDFATKEERSALLLSHRSTLWSLGLVASVPSFIPALMWLGGSLATLILPMLALAAVWLYVMVFLASSLLFSHYLMPALKQSRAQFEQTQAALSAAKHSETIALPAVAATPSAAATAATAPAAINHAPTHTSPQ
jgi:Etoposide-induced protein 2.4 (EI24)